VLFQLRLLGPLVVRGDLLRTLPTRPTAQALVPGVPPETTHGSQLLNLPIQLLLSLVMYGLWQLESLPCLSFLCREKLLEDENVLM
jgi:hypothetical protein